MEPEAENLAPTPSEVVDFMGAQRVTAQSRIISGMEGEPDNAARAMELSQATNDDPVLIHSDLDNYEKQLKTGMASMLVRNNQHLQDYINSHPLASTISNDDWGQLDRISYVMNRLAPGLGMVPYSVVGAAAKGFAEGHGADIGLPQEDLDRITSNPLIQKFIGEVLPGLGLVHEANRVMSGVLTGASAAAEQLMLNATGSETQAAKFARDVNLGLQTLPGELHGIAPPEVTSIAKQVGEVAQVAKPWADAGVPPPARLHPLLVQAAKQEAKNDLKAFDDIYKESQKSSTLARDPESFRRFAEIKFGDSTIGISAEKIQELYGDSSPTTDDNKLGWVPNIQEQYEAAITSGRDIEVPWKDLLARATPETIDVIYDGLRLRPDGLTLDETKEVEARTPAEQETIPAKEKKPDEGPVPIQPQSALAQAVGLKPDYSTGWETAEGLSTPEKLLDLGEGKPGEVTTPEGTGRTIATHMLGDIMDKLDYEHLPKGAQLLSKFWGARIKELAGDIPLHIMEREEFRKVMRGRSKDAVGTYWGNNIFIPHDTTLLDSGTFSQVILHEAAHAISVQELAGFPQLKAAVRQLMNETNQYLIKADKNARDMHDYAFTNEKEFIAEGVANPAFREVLAKTPISKELAAKLGLGEKTGTVWDAVKNIFKDLWAQITGKVPEDSVMDAFFRIGEALEEANKELRKMSEEDISEAPPIKEEDLAKSPFKNAATVGLVKARLEGYLRLIKEQQDREAKFSRDQEQLASAARSTKEWNANYDRVREEAKTDLLSRPDVAADRFLRTGELPNGQKLQKIKLRLTDPALGDGMPGEFISDGGIDPDTLAPVFGYQSGDQLVRSVAKLNKDRELAGQTPAGFLRVMTDAETERRMQREYGRSAQDIIDDAKEHVVSPTAMDLLHTELAALYEGSGQKPITKDQLKAQARKIFEKLPIGTHASDKYLAAMGREGEKAEAALIEGNPTEALQAKQKQALLAHQAKLALALEKQRKQFESRADKWGRREPPGIQGEDAIWIHDILLKIGMPVKRSIQDLERSKELLSDHTDLRSYAQKINDLHGIKNQDRNAMPPSQTLPIPDFLYNPSYRNTVDEMLPGEFRGVFDALKGIDAYSRDERTETIRGDKRDHSEFVSGLVERLGAAVDNQPVAKNAIAKGARALGSLLLTPETWFLRLDLGNKFGPFSQFFTRKAMEGQYTLRGYERDFAKRWKALPDYGPRRKIENPGLFVDGDGNSIPLTTHSMWAILQNMGNELQRQKLMKGYGIDDIGKVWQFLLKNGLKEEHITRAQEMGDIYSDAFALDEQARISKYGFAPARIDLDTFDTPFGPKREWYHPLIPDSMLTPANIKPADLMEDSGFYRPAPASGFTKGRTGAVYPLDLTFDLAPFKLKQILNSAAMLESVTDIAKVVYDKKFSTAFKKFYGPEYYDELQKWLKDISGQREWMPAGQKLLDAGVNGLRQNMATLLIGWNLGTVLKHFPTATFFSAREVGPINFAKEAIPTWLGLRGDDWRFAMETSEEIQNRVRSASETISAGNQDLFKRYDFSHKVFGVRDAIQLIGSYPVAMSDLISAVPMWTAAYKAYIGKGMDLGEAVYAANTDVRRTHGSTILSSRPGIMRTNAWVQTFMPFYNFFSNALQRNYEMAWKAKLAKEGRELPAMTGFEKETFEKGMKHLPEILGGVLVFGVMISLVEQMVDPIDPKEGVFDTNPLHWPLIIARGPTSLLPGVRDLFQGLASGRDPSSGIMGTAFRNAASALSPKTWTGGDHARQLRVANQALGTFTGMTYDEFGKLGQYFYNVSQRKDKMNDVLDFYKGVRHGTAKERR